MNQGHPVTRIVEVVLCLLAVTVLALSGAAPAAETGRGEELLLDSYRDNLSQLRRSSFGLPLMLESFEQKNKSRVDVFGVIDYPFASVAEALGTPANWCDIAAMNPNVKACTYEGKGGVQRLTLYVGRKVYKAPEDAQRVVSRFSVAERRAGYIDVLLAADTGPYGTRDYRMEFQAVPVAEGKTFVKVGFEYGESLALRMAEKAYYATLGRSRTGFTVVGRDDEGRPVLVGGRRGAIERNTVRYYFAIRSFLQMLRFPAEQRFSRSIDEWYGLTSRYGQLDTGLTRKEYLDIKARERRNQLELQQRIQP